MKARVIVTLKTGVLDPQGKAIEGALASLGVDGIASVRRVASHSRLNSARSIATRSSGSSASIR